MKITGGNSYVIFDLENGYVLKADGEMLLNKAFVVYKSSMCKWEYPHDDEELSIDQIDGIINQVKESMNDDTVQIVFE